MPRFEGAATVLLVSSAESREMYAESLRASGLKVRSTVNPEEALAALAVDTPAVIVSDLSFSKSALDGLAFIRALRQQEHLRMTPVIVTSGYGREEDRQRARDAGADLYLMNPWPEHLLSEVRRALICGQEGRRLTWNWPSVASKPPLVERRRPTVS
jgi:CheY-like chemotaxis protein